MRAFAKRLPLIVLVIVVLLAAIGWMRMGKILVEVDGAALAKQPEPTGEAMEFTAVAYNVQARPWFDDSVHKFERIPKVTNAYDIVTLQECFKDHGRFWKLATQPVKVYDGTLKAPWKIVGSGLGTLSRFPLTETAVWHYTTAGDFQNKPASKGILLTRFEVGGFPLDVYTTHKEAGKNDEAMASKRKQAQEMVDFVKVNSKPESAVIVLGDFNLRFKQPDAPGTGIPETPPTTFEGLDYYDIIGGICAHLGLRDARTELLGEPHPGVDHVLYRTGNGVELKALTYQHDGPEFYDENQQPLSDHEPVIVKFRIGKPAPAAETTS